VSEDKSGLSAAGAGETTAPAVFWDGYGLDAPRSGVFVHARHLADALVKRGIRPVVVGHSSCMALSTELEYLALQDPSFFAAIARLKPVWPARVARRVEAARPANRDRVILHGLSNINIPWLGRHERLRRVVTVHDAIPLLEPAAVSRAYYWQLRAILPRVLRAADRIICVSRWTRNTLTVLFPDCESKTVVIPNGVPSLEITSLPEKTDTIRALYVARWEPYKRLDMACNLVRKAAGGLRLSLVTDAKGVDFCYENAGDLIAVGHLVVLTGVGEQALRELYQSVDVYLHTSRLEGFCLPAAEALAVGRPLVYEEGSGIDEVSGREVSVPVTAGASPAIWLAALEKAASLGRTPEFPRLLSRHHAGLSSWGQAAAALEKLYNELS